MFLKISAGNCSLATPVVAGLMYCIEQVSQTPENVAL